ncbi:MAG: response regulator [Magnetococcales bacterium]|nr:response regulator [Magnetococcales bacterium]MBF0150393.1 response regulator [Magnetococcales bacterium]MBF0172107.1 response regulator [Magnetococcales bacterium]MBF0629881.1 response regulator [Magnetococcales bacterium]
MINEDRHLILVVDDDSVILQLLDAFLRENHFSVLLADNGFDGLKIFEQHHPDLVLLDAQMPLIDGFDTCRKIKTLPGGDDVPVIIVTSLSSGEAINRVFQAGAEDYISKPINWDLLRQRMRRILRHKASFLALREKEEQIRLATDSQSDAIITADGMGNIVFWNRGAELIFGYTKEEVLGRPLTMLMPYRFASQHIEAVNRVRETGKMKMSGRLLELLGQRKSREEFPMEISITHWYAGKKMFFSAVIRDISERKKALGGQEGLALFDFHIIDQILALVNRVHPQRAGLLEFHHVKSIMENVFLAGLRREEDLPVKVSVTLGDETLISNTPGFDAPFIHFDTPVPFTVDSLVKLGPGFDPATTSLFVRAKHNAPRNLEIWGAMFSSTRGRGMLDPFPFQQEPLQVLTIITRKTGSLVIRWGERMLAHFQSGHFSEPVADPFENCIIASTLMEVVSAHPEYRTSGELYWEIYRSILMLLLRRSAEDSTGGTVIWLPEAYTIRTQESLIDRYPLLESQEGAKIIDEYCQLELKKRNLGDSVSPPDDQGLKAIGQALLDVKRRMIEHTEFLSHLTRIDGAVIISHRLKPIAFGAILAANTWNGQVLYDNRDGTRSGHDVDRSKYGTRHGSAVDFVARYPGAVAFVLSHDGPVSAMTFSNDAVFWVPDYISTY